MKPHQFDKTLWISAGIVVILYLLFLHYTTLPFTVNSILFLIEIGGFLLNISFLGFILALIMAIFPCRGLSYWERLSITFPLGVILYCILAGIFLYTAGPFHRVP